MMTKEAAQLLINIATEWQERWPLRVFQMGAGGTLQEALLALNKVVSAPSDEPNPKPEPVPQPEQPQ